MVVGDVELDYGESVNVSVLAEGAVGIEAKIGSDDVAVSGFIIPISGLDAGNYTLTVTAIPDKNHNPVTRTARITVDKLDTALTAGDVTMVYGGGKNLVATLKDAKGKSIGDAKVTVKLGDISRILTTDRNGQASLSLNGIIPDNYTAAIIFEGNDVYKKSSASAKVNITKLQSKVYLRNALYFVLQTKMVKVTLWGTNNEPLAGKTVHITLNEYGLKYSGVTDKDGTATIRVGVGFGVHSATVSFDGDEIYCTSNRTGSIRVIKETPSVMVRGADTQFKASDNPKIVKVYLWDRTSKPLPAGSKIVLKINGQSYVGFTDSSGVASIKININRQGTYSVQATYGGNSAYNAVTRSIKIKVS